VAAAEAEFWESPDFSHTAMPAGVPDALRSAATRFLDEYRSELRPFETEYAVAPGVVAYRAGGHTPGHSVVRLASGDDRLTFAGDAVFQRATVVDITKAGRARVAKVLPGHIQVVRSLLFDALSDRDVHTLGDIMTRARDHMRARPPRSASPRRRHGPDAPTNQLASQDPLDE
jgi:glyoxylase-like metal-dependent hydrolase (beta-lactamase superfamily II)